MSVEDPIEIQFVPPRLHALFDGRITPLVSGSLAERESNFLSRALAAFAIHKLTGCSHNDAAASVVDGGGDGGLDAIRYVPESHTLWVAQSKFHRNGRGEPALGDVMKFKVGIENLLQGNFQAFSANDAMRRLMPDLVRSFDDPDLEVRAVLVYSGINLVSEDRRHLFEELRKRYQPESDYLQFHCYNLTTIHAWITGADEDPGVPEVELTLLKPGWIQNPYETVYGILTLHALADLYRQHGKRLIAANIRGYRGDTAVNEQIASTARDEPQHFFYLNNGLTAYCARLEVRNHDKANAEQKRIRAFGFSIVNGAQTIGSIAESGLDATVGSQGVAFLKLISLERCPDEVTFADRITRTTNFQNQVGARDLIAIDREQERIANQLLPAGVYYHHKSAWDTPDPDETNFTLEEATTACAALSTWRDGDLCTRILTNRASLWSLHPVYPAENPQISRYAAVFRPELSARTIWRAVQIQRLMIAALRSGESGVRKDFFTYGRWLVLHVLFLKLPILHGTDLALTPSEVSLVTTCAQEYAEKLWLVCQSKGFVGSRDGGGWETTRHFKSIFCAPGDCHLLRDGLLALL